MEGDTVQYPATFEGLLQLIKRLRAPDGCPWDRRQTPRSMTGPFLEECYELVEAIEEGQGEAVAEELGDVLLNLGYQLEFAREEGRFDAPQVFRRLIDKLVRRHPHVFGQAQADTAEEVLARWEAIKGGERAEASLMEGLPKTLPALAQAQALQERAARVGFDWSDPQGVAEKVAEEVAELQGAASDQERRRELGDLLFSLVNLARWLDLDAEACLREANARFRRRFAYMERLARERGLSLAEMSMEEKEALWQKAKRAEAGEGRHQEAEEDADN